ncbi:DUF1173 family protein [Paraburkholderia sp. JHI869]|uniref:DUF1173 family protein n=1 Tax=Paraburkholderia sp. JHI869 TaxID=3112959 RepID=UPI00317A14F6
MFEVSFDGERVPLTEVQEHPARFARRLERAKVVPGFAQCHCRTDAPRRLVIRRYGSRFHLAGWPDDGVHHAEGCDFQKKPGTDTALGPDSLSAIIAGPAGLNVRLDVSLVQQETGSRSRTRDIGGSTRASRRSAPLLAFLHALWTSGGLTFWHGTPKSRSWGSVNAMLHAGMGEAATINGSPAHDILHVMRRFEQEERAAINGELAAFKRRIVNDGGVSRRALILGEIATVADTQFGKKITLRQHPQQYFASMTLVDQATKKYRHAWRAVGKPTARVVALLLVERMAERYLRIVDLAAMLCSSVFLPCDSIHEVAMANRLVAEHRRFEKPIRMADGEEMLADFVLLDTHPPTHVEIYGMNGLASYEQRKAEKQALRRTQGIPAVEWNVDRENLAAIKLPVPIERA